METLRIHGVTSFGLNMQNKITKINYVPKKFVYNETTGLYIKWRLSDVRIASRIVEGPFRVCYEDGGEFRKKLRYNVIIWPEIVYEPTPEIKKFVNKKNKRGNKLQSLIHLNRPPVEKLKRMEEVAAELYYQRKNKHDGKNSTAAKGYTTFKLEELGEVETVKPLEKVGTFVSKLFAFLLKKSENGLPCGNSSKISAERLRRPLANPEDIADVRKCMKVVMTKEEDFYVSEDCPWYLTSEQYRKRMWKLMHKIMSFEKLTVTTLTCDLDLKNYAEVKKAREEELFEMQERVRIMIPSERSL